MFGRAGPFVLASIFIGGWVYFKLLLHHMVKSDAVRIAWFSKWPCFFVVAYYLTVPACVSRLQDSYSSEAYCHGLPWGVHCGYALLLVLTAPATTMPLEALQDYSHSGKLEAYIDRLTVPVFGCKGVPAEAFAWVMDLVFRGDQYTDACSVALAYLSDYPEKDVMLGLYVAGLVVQPLLTLLLTRSCGNSGDRWLLLAVLLGWHPMTMAPSDKSWAEVVRFLTESLPQPILQIYLARHLARACGEKRDYTIYVSIAMGFLVAFKGFATAICYVSSQVWRSSIWERLRFLRQGATRTSHSDPEESVALRR